MIIPIGIVCLDSKTKERLFYPVSVDIPLEPKEPAHIVKQPTPEEVEIEKEREPDFSLTGLLSKHHEKDLPKNPLL